MANKKITYTLELDAEIKDLESKLNKTKSSLDSIFKSGQAPAGLEKAFERLGELFDRIKDKAKSPIDSKSGFTSIGKDVDSVNQSLNALSRILSEIASKGTDNFTLLPKDTQAQITAIIKSIESYGAAIQASTVETKELIVAREALAKATAKIQDAQANVNTKSALFEQAKQERDALQAQIDVIKERQRVLKEAKIEQAKVDSFYSKPGEDGKPRDRRRKYEGVSSTPAQAKAKTDALIAASKGDDAELASLTEQLKRAKKDIESYNTQLGTANRTLREANTAAGSAQESFDRLNDAFQSGSEQKKQKAFDELKQKAKELGVEIDDIGNAFSQEDANTLIKRLNSVSDKAFEKFTDNAKEAADAVEDLGENTRRVKDKLEDGTEALQNMTDAASQREAFEGKIKQFLGLSGAAQVLRSALRDAMATITELDATMTEMAVVTDLTVGDYWDQLPEYSKQASDLGVSINSAYKAATLYYQQGLKGNEVTKISAETLKLAKIAGIDAADATNKMTAALRGFNMELNEASAQKVADVYAELAAITAADVDEISNAMTKTASIASSAGMEFETTAAFLSQIIETTRESAETAGTALKTVIARFQELKKDPSEIGEIDGEIVDANKIETALRSVGVALRDSSGQFRDLDDVFMDLSKKWDGLDKNTQRYIATIAAGSRQQSRFIAMMSDYGRTQELVSAANTSAGASNRQFEKTMDSLEAKVEKLKNAWHEFTMGIVNSDLVKIGVDILTKFLEIVNRATSGLDGLAGSFTKIISVVGIFKLASKIFGKIKQPLVSFFAEVVKMSREEGEKAGKAYDEGTRKGVEQAREDAKQKSEKQDGQTQQGQAKNDSKKGLGIASGFSSIGKTFSDRASAKKNLVDAQAKRDAAELELTNAGKEFNDTYEKFGAEAKETTAAFNKATKAELNFAKATEELEDAQKSYVKTSSAVTTGLAEGIQQIGSGISTLGALTSAFGGVLSSLGAEEAGEGFAALGNGIMVAGTALTVVTPLIKLFSFTVQGESTKLIIAGYQTQLAWWWIFIIITALVALIVIIALVVAAVKKAQANSPEGQLKAAAEAAEKAAEAADKAKEAYNGLADAFENISDKYAALYDLTEGTREWNEAVLELNSSVLDLIKQYPELSNLVTNDNGVLKIDLDSEEAQDVLNKAFETTVATSNIQLAAEADVLKKQANVDRKELTDKTFFHYDAVQTVYKQVTPGSQQTIPEEKRASEGWDIKSGTTFRLEQLTEEQIDKYAKAMAKGSLADEGSAEFDAFLKELDITKGQFEYLQNSIQDSQDAIRKYGNSLLQKEQQEKVMYDTMATSVVNLVDTLGMSDERVKQMFNIADGTDYQQAYDEVFNKISGDNADMLNDSGDEDTFKELANNQLKGLMSEQDIQDAFTNAGYKDAKVNNAKGWVEYTDAEGKTQKITDEAEMEKIIATHYAQNVVKKRAEFSDIYISQLSDKIKEGRGEVMATSFEKALMDESGDFLTAADVTNLEKMTKTDYEAYFKQLPQAIKNIYGSVDNLYKEVQNAITGAGFAKESGFEGVSSGAAKALAKMRESVKQDKQGSFTTQFNKIMASEDLSQEQKDFFSQQIASLSTDPTNREAWDSVKEKLADYGEAVASFINEQQELFDTRYSDTYLQNLGASQALIDRYNAAQGDELDNFHNTFKKWKKDYDTANSEAAKADHELMTQTIEAIINSREKQIEAYEEAANAEAEANSNLITKISENVARLRELREKEEAEKAITDNLAKQAYLSMDTSGANSLELLQLEEEGKQLTQQYEDQMIDQAIAKMEEDNQLAFEQRERQIDLMREQLEVYSNSEQILIDAKELINEATETLFNGDDLTNTALGQLLAPEQFKSELEEADFWNNLYKAISGRAETTNDTGDSTPQKTQAEIDADTRNQIISGLTTATHSGNRLFGNDYATKKQSYIDAGGTAEDFDRKLIAMGISIDNEVGQGIDYSGENTKGYTKGESIFNSTDLSDGKTDEGVISLNDTLYHLKADGKSKRVGFEDPGDGKGKLEIVTTPGTNKAKLYINFGGTGYEIMDALDRKSLLSSLGLQAYKTGGLADFTGPAWLDGTKSRPEYVLNADQTERFFSLVDVLEGFDSKDSTTEKSGDNYFDIKINVDKLENDYDIEQMANKIRRMIYEDATYRNVNTINLIR